MGNRFLLRQAVQLGLAANATRPVTSGPGVIPAFFAGWLAGELAPHLAVATTLDAGNQIAHLRIHGRRDKLSLALAGVNVAMYASLLAAGQRARVEIDHALREALGPNYATEVGSPLSPTELATPWRRLVWPFSMAHPEVVAKRRLAYAPGGRRFELDVYHHRDMPQGRPVLLQIHGGGWVIGNKDQQGIPLMMQMASHGWVTVAVNYPLSPRSRWPAHLVAVKRAVAWIREHIDEYGGDPSFLAVTGGSAGGHLAAMLALTPADKSLQPGFEEVDTAVQACVPHYGVYDFTDESGQKYASDRLEALIRRWIMAPDAVYPDAYRAASPLFRIGDDVPPFFVIHGTTDTVVPVIEARTFVDKLRACSSNPVGYAELGGAQHAFDVFPSVRSAHVVRGVQQFLDWTYARERTRAAGSDAADGGRAGGESEAG